MLSRIRLAVVAFGLLTLRAGLVAAHTRAWRLEVGGCTYVGYLPGGKHAVAEYPDSAPRILAIGRRISTLQRLPAVDYGKSEVFSRGAALSPNGRYFAAAEAPKAHAIGDVLVWRISAKSRLVNRFAGVSMGGARFAFSPNSELLAAGRLPTGRCRSVGLVVWSVPRGRIVARCPWFPGLIRWHFPRPLAVGFLGDQLVAASIEHGVAIWDARNGKLVTFRTHRLAISMQGVSGGHLLAIVHPYWGSGETTNLGKPTDPVGTADLAILRIPSEDRARVLTWRAGRGLGRNSGGLYFLGAGISAAAIATPNCRFVIATQASHRPKPWEPISNFLVIRLSDGRIIYRSAVFKGWIHSLAFSRRRRRLLLAGYWGVRLFRLPLNIWREMGGKKVTEERAAAAPAHPAR